MKDSIMRLLNNHEQFSVAGGTNVLSDANNLFECQKFMDYTYDGTRTISYNDEGGGRTSFIFQNDILTGVTVSGESAAFADNGNFLAYGGTTLSADASYYQDSEITVILDPQSNGIAWDQNGNSSIIVDGKQMKF